LLRLRSGCFGHDNMTIEFNANALNRIVYLAYQNSQNVTGGVYTTHVSIHRNFLIYDY